MTFALLVPSLALGADLPASVQAVVEQAELADLPTSLLEQKALEGLAKGVPEARITTVLDDLLAQWKGADRVLGERARAPDRADLVPAAAAALQQGAPSGVVSSLSSEPRPIAALWTLSDMLYAGLSPPDAERLVRQALANRQPEMALRELPEATRLLIAEEGPAGAAQELSLTMAEGSTPLAAVTDAGPGNSADHSKAGGNGKGSGAGTSEGKPGGKSP
jgi:hypothetical protein